MSYLQSLLKLPSWEDNLECPPMLERRREKTEIPLELDRSQRGKLRDACTMSVALERVAGAAS